MKMTMQTPGRSITVELPGWLENRILKLFISAVKIEAAQPRKDGDAE